MLEISFLLALTIHTGLLSGAVIIILDKYELFDRYEERRMRWMPESCRFCLGFWLGWVVMFIFFWITGQEFRNLYWLAGFAAAPIARLVSK